MVIPDKSGNLVNWLRQQYGEGRKYPTPRQLSLAASDGRNPNMVAELENRGSARAETLEKLANTLGVPLVQLFVLTGWIQESDLSGSVLSDEHERIIKLWDRVPHDERPLMERLIRVAGDSESDSVSLDQPAERLSPNQVNQAPE